MKIKEVSTYSINGSKFRNYNPNPFTYFLPVAPL